MNDYTQMYPGQVYYVDAQGRTIRPFCQRHGRWVGASGMCPSCQREAVEAAEERAEVEHARQVAYAQECEVRAQMWEMV